MSADFAFLLPPTGKGDELQRGAAAAASPTASAAAEESPTASATAACDMFRAASLRQQQETVTVPSTVKNETRGSCAKKRPAATVSPATAAAAAPPPASEAALDINAAIAASTRPQRARRPPRKFEVESADPDISYKKALEKSRLETRRVEVDYASLPSIPEIKVASSDEFLVNPVAFYERLERYGREYGGVKIVPPAGWRPPFSLRELLDDALEFNVRVQDIHMLMQGAKFRHPPAPQRASGLREKDRQMKREQFGTEKPLLQQVEALYWQSVETSFPELTVHYAADLKTNEVGSGFPTQNKGGCHLPQKPGGRCACVSVSSGCTLQSHAGECCRRTPASMEGTRASRVIQEHVPKQVEAEEEEQENVDGTSTVTGEEANGRAERKTSRSSEGETEEKTRVVTAVVAASAGQAEAEHEKNVRGDVEAQDAKSREANAENYSRDAGKDTEALDSTVRGAACTDVGKQQGKKRKTLKESQGGLDDVAPVPAAAAGFELENEEQQEEEAAFYAWHPWNLTRFARQRGSLLSSYHRDVAGVTSPWLYVGMIFSTFCWHAEDNYFAACNYHHWGDAKLWYIVPPSRAASVERMLQRYLNTKDSDYVLHSLTVQLPPSLFIQHRVPVYRVEQKENEFIMLWPRTYHAGFNAGFNCNEACNFAPASWLPWGHRSIYSYRFMRSTCIPFHQLLLRAACSAEGLAASQLLHMCKALLRLLHEEYALRRTAKEEHVATGLMSLGNSHVSQLDVLMPDAEGVDSEFLSCRPALQYIVGKPLLPDTVSPPPCVAESNNRTAACSISSGKVVPTLLSRVPAESDEAANASAEGITNVATQTRSFLDAVAGVASLPVKDCDNCRSCCAISCVTCPHIIEHTCLECVGQQTCSCKLQVAVVRFPLPTLWAIFDHVRSLFLSICKQEDDALTQRQISGSGGADGTNTSKERDCFQSAASSVEECGGDCKERKHVEGREGRSSVFDAREHTHSNEEDILGMRSETDMTSGNDWSLPSSVTVEAASKRRASQSHWQEGSGAPGCADRDGEISRMEERSDATSRKGCERYVEAVHPVPWELDSVEEAMSLTVEQGWDKLGERLSLQPRETGPSTSKSTAQQERRKPQQKRGHRGGCRRDGDRVRSGSVDAHSSNKRREDELLQDPLYIGLPSLDELAHFEEAAQLLESFSREYSRGRTEAVDSNQNTAVAAREDEKAENGGQRSSKQVGSPEAPEREACVSGSKSGRCTSKDECYGESSNKKDELDPLGSSAPPSVTFEERKGSLYMRGKNWSLEAVVSLCEAEALEMAKGDEVDNSVFDENPHEYAGAQRDRPNLLRRGCERNSSPSSRECSPIKSRCDTYAAQSPDERSVPSASSLNNRHVVGRTARCRLGCLKRGESRIQEERTNPCKKRGAGQPKGKNVPGAEAMKTLVRQLTWRYFLSALKDEEEDNDERILPVFRKAGTPLLNEEEA